MPGITSGGSVIADCGAFDRGVSFCRHTRELYDGQSPFMKNMIYESNMLRTRAGQKRLETEGITGDIHSCCRDMFFGRYVFHQGTCLYSFDGKVLQLLSDGLPDCDSFVFEMNSALHFYLSDVRIFNVDREFNVSERIIGDVRLAHNANFNYSEYTPDEVEDNMVMFRVCVDYVGRDVGNNYYILPEMCDTNYPLIFTSLSGGDEIKVAYTVLDKRVELSDRKIYTDCRISFVPAKESVYRNFDKIFGCRQVCTYGGNSSGGTRVFFAGNREYPGYYFYSELLSPFCVRRLSYDILGNGSENINRLAVQKGRLIALCDRSIYKIVYSFDRTDGPDFTVSEISTRIGCDSPGSVQLIDNRLVFANSSGGIFIIVSSEYTDELSIRRISANISGTSHTSGLLSESVEEIKNGISADFDGKYMFAVPSGNAYVWDYGRSPYVADSNPLVSERKLAWYYFDGICEKYLFELDGVLFGLQYFDGRTDIVCFSKDICDDFGKVIDGIYRSPDFDGGNGFAKKSMRELYVNAAGSDGAVISIEVICDGESVCTDEFTLCESAKTEDAAQRLLVMIPAYEAYRISFVIRCISGSCGLYDAAIKMRKHAIYYR